MSATETGFPLGYEMKPGDKIKVIAARPGVEILNPGAVVTIKECSVFRMMHIDERTNQAAKGWVFIVE